MKLHRVQIDQQMAKLSIETQMATIKIETPKREMQIESRDANMNVKRENGKVELDMSNFKDKVGLKSMRDLNEDSIAKAKGELIQSIKQSSSEYDQIAKLPSTGNEIAQAARRRLLSLKMPEMNSGEVPKQPVEMTGKPGSLNIDWTKNDLVIKWGKYEPPVITVEPKPSVNVELAQKPAVECEVVEMSIPPETGRTFDTMA